MSQPANPVDPAQVPYPGSAPQPPKRNWFARHKILTTLGALVVVGVALAAAGGGGSETPDAAAPSVSSPADPKDEPAADPKDEPADESKDDAKKEPGVGDPVRDGKFEFTVTSVEPGVKEIGDDILGTTAQGEFVLVKVTVENIGDEAQMFDGSSQIAFDAKDRKFSSDGGAAIYLDGAESFLNDINPGNSVDATVVFDVPKGTELAALELHDSAFSGGVKVTL